MEDKNVLVKTAAWTHNTNVNRAGYSPLTLVTGRAVTIPELTMGNEGSESVTDSEAVRRIMDTIHKVTKEFREAETKVKLKECQGVRIRSYQHQDKYVQGDKVWFQYKDGSAWHGPGEVIYQKGYAVFIHSNGDVRKVAACKVKPYELKERKEESKKEEAVKLDWNGIIEKDGRSEFRVVREDEKDEQKEKEEEAENEKEVSEEQGNEEEVEGEKLKDVIEAKYLKMEKSVCFMESSVYVVEVPVRDHGKAEVIEAKGKEIENLKLYETFEEIDDEGQETIGSSSSSSS